MDIRWIILGYEGELPLVRGKEGYRIFYDRHYIGFLFHNWVYA